MFLSKAKGTCDDYAKGGPESSISPFSSSLPSTAPSPAAQPASPVTEGESKKSPYDRLHKN